MFSNLSGSGANGQDQAVEQVREPVPLKKIVYQSRVGIVMDHRFLIKEFEMNYRESVVLARGIEGHDSKSIVAMLTGMTLGQVSVYRSTGLAKAGCKSICELAVFCHLRGWLKVTERKPSVG